ncbi:Uncharacterized protein HZ326_29320 [Fusarium oxysporum f. sp. albedinis]|nr:Uncharacterized protein HZ326_29320 [Fusarium oxysporum f. sp. albedinis]
MSHTHVIDGAILLVPPGIASAKLLPEARTVRSLSSLRNHWIRLPGKHTQALYDICKRREAGVLSQLRTGMARINSYLNKIGAAESDMCECGCGPETMEHFLFRCTRWEAERDAMRRVGQNMMGNLSFFLGGKSASDGAKWRPVECWRVHPQLQD